MRITVLLLSMTITTSLFSQDYLYKKDGSVIPVKEVHSTIKTISYKIYNDTTNYKYLISALLVDSIVYQSGSVTKFSPQYFETDKRSMVGMDYPNPNTVYFDFYELIFLYNINIGYEYMFVRPQIGLSLVFTRSLSRRNTVYGYEDSFDLWSLFSSPEYGFKIAFNYYALNTTRFNYGLRLINYTIYYQNKIYTTYYDDYKIEKSAYNIFGLGVFARYQFGSSVYGLTALDAYFDDNSFFSIYPLPQFAIGFNF